MRLFVNATTYWAVASAASVSVRALASSYLPAADACVGVAGSAVITLGTADMQARWQALQG